jgi:hypothetical protein
MDMDIFQARVTKDPLSYASPVGLQPEFLRLPRPGERDPVFGLSRGFLNFLILPTKANNYRPPVVSCVLRLRGARTGVRLVDIASLRAFILAHREPRSGGDKDDHGSKDLGADI